MVLAPSYGLQSGPYAMASLHRHCDLIVIQFNRIYYKTPLNIYYTSRMNLLNYHYDTGVSRVTD